MYLNAGKVERMVQKNVVDFYNNTSCSVSDVHLEQVTQVESTSTDLTKFYE